MNYNKVERNIKKLIGKEDICYINLMQMFEQLACDYVYVMQHYSDVLDLDEAFNNHVSYLEILKQTLKFMKSINYDYYILLKNAYKTKEININFRKKEGAYCEYRNNKKFINWPINYNIDDSFSLTHEFSHYLNLIENVNLTRSYFTEAFSFLFEFLLYDYLEINNYANKEYLKIKLIKFATCYDYAEEIYTYGNLITIYLKYKKLNDKIIEENCDDKILLEQIKQQCHFYKKNLPFFQNKKYLLGIFIACDMHQQLLQNPNYIEKIFYLINNVNRMSLNDFFKELNIKIENNNHNLNFDNTSYNRLLSNLKLELDGAYKKFRVMDDEKSYCNCRTYSSRKNEIKC